MEKPSGHSVFDLKAADMPMLQLILKSCDLDAIAAELRRRYESDPDFFDNDPVVIDLSRVADAPAPDFAALRHLLRACRLTAIGVAGGCSSQQQAAQEAGLAPIRDCVTLPHAQAPAPTPPQQIPAPTAPIAQPAMVIERPIRSGQQVYARGRDLVVLATVNAGAEVISDGNIHIYGQLRGKALAGARGDVHARIFATHLQPELVSVAGVYRTSEKPLPIEVAGKPAQVRLSDGTLVMTPLGG